MIDAIAEICRRNEEIRSFWGHCHGWAPSEAALLLERSRLDRQVALSRCLTLWTPEAHPPERWDGVLILGWANLGALVEGTLKWFLSVFRNNVPDDSIKRFGRSIEPKEATLEQLRQFYSQHFVWLNKAEQLTWDPWLVEIRDRRNSVHAYMDKDIGTFEDLQRGIERYLDLIATLDGRVPYDSEH